jgi:hypothetical protein
VVRDERRIELFNTSTDLPFCSYGGDCWAACRVWFGDDEECVRHGLHPERPKK